MTMPGAVSAAGAHAPAGSRVWRVELTETVKLALPLALSQLGQIAMMTTDLALIGRLGDQAVAAAALAHTVLFTMFVIGMGIVQAVAPLAAQAFGARRPRMVRRALRVGIWAAVILGVPLTWVQLWGDELLVLLGQSRESAALAERYLLGMAWCMVPGWIFMALRNFMSAVNRPEPALWITLAAIPINGVLAYALIYGAFGLPALDLLGAGLATTIVNIGMCVAAVWFCYARRPFRKYHVLGRFWRFDWTLMRQLIVVGAPMSGTFLLEYGVFAAAAQLMGWIGTAALAAHQIALQIAAIMFMVPLGIGMAATVRVGHEVGRGDAAAARRAGFVAIVLGIAFMATMTLLVALTRHQAAALVPRQSGARPADHRDRCLAAGARRDVLHRGRRAGGGGERAARAERHARAAPVCRGELLADRLCGMLVLRLHARARRLRHLDRPLDRHRGLRRAADLALPSTHRAALSSGDRDRAGMTERLTISRLGHRGDGIAETPDGLVYVPYTLPGEMVEVEVVPGHPDRRHLLRVESASPERIQPVCPHFGICGGCQTQHWDFARYRDWKRSLVVEALRQAGLDAPVGELIDAHGEGRRRAVFHARGASHGVLEVGFAAWRAHHIVGIDRCPVLAPSLDGALPAAWAIAEAIGPGKPLDIQVTATDAGLDIDVRGSGPLGARHTAALARLAETHRLARLTRHGELIVQRIVPTVRMGKATVALPPGAFLQATAEGEAVHWRGWCRSMSERPRPWPTCSAAPDHSRCGSRSVPASWRLMPTRPRSRRSAKRQKRLASSRLRPKRAICSAARSLRMS